MSLQLDNLVKFDNLSQVVSSAFNISAGSRTPIAQQNPLRIYLGINLQVGSSSTLFFPVSPKSNQPLQFNTSNSAAGWLEFEINKHYSLCTCEWDIFDNANNLTVVVVEVLYGGK